MSMAFLTSDGSKRAAETVLWANGGFNVNLRLPDQATSGSDAEQLGLGSQAFQDYPAGPAVWRRNGEAKDLLLAAESVATLVGAQTFRSAEALFQMAIGIVVDGVLYTIVNCVPVFAAGSACAYRVSLQAPSWT